MHQLSSSMRPWNCDAQVFRVTGRVSVFIWLAALLFISDAMAADEPADYLTQVKPILQQRCYACHGALKQEAGLRLDTAALIIKGGESGTAVVAGEMAESSILLKRIAASNAEERMPPSEEGEPLTAEQIELIRRWIAAGAKSPMDEQPETDPSQHWAFQPIVRPSVPADSSDRCRTPIDAFLEQQQRKHGVSPQPEAARIIQLRRLYLDLIGIPPNADEIAACEANGSPLWYEQTVKQLLDDPRHGERWARHWMDIWRYSDWWGLGDQLRNSQKHIWHWRDWIVESLNADTPYDEMIRLMLAADELHPNDLGKLRATGYLARNYWLFNRPQWMEETVEHVSKGLLGLTMNCARCHDHKYDPIAQDDYYRLRAFFEPYHVRMDVVPGESDLTHDGIPRIFDGLLDEPTYLYIRGDEGTPDKSKVIPPGIPQVLSFSDLTISPVNLPEEAQEPERRPWVFEAYLLKARQQAETAKAEVQKTQEKLQVAESTETELVKEDTESKLTERESHSQVAVDSARADWKIAEAALVVAMAELESTEKRADAQRAEWDPADASRQEKSAAAIMAERRVQAEKNAHTLAVAEKALLVAAADKKAAAEKAVQDSRVAHEKSRAALQAEIKPEEKFTRMTGAAWTPTRFFNSGKDDPEVKFSSTSTGRRTALAIWLTDRRNPLTARVAVNHIWTRHMGQPLVPTVFDFGRKGTPPVNQELLDWLAAELIESGWSMKHLHSLIVESAVYRMSSSMAGAESNSVKDPENRYWWRRVPIRMESQLVRDSLLSIAGILDSTMGGPSIPADQQAASTRRSLYFFHSNNDRSLFLTTFDEALVKDCYRREQSIVPQQALALSNSQLALDASQQIAQRLSNGVPEDEDFARSAFRVVTGINAGEAEITASVSALESWRKLSGGSPETARANLIWALINHNDFVTLR